jgi:hypothetical protein
MRLAPFTCLGCRSEIFVATTILKEAMDRSGGNLTGQRRKRPRLERQRADWRVYVQKE